MAGPENARPDLYWHVILCCRGRELSRSDNRICFFWQGEHGWDYYWTTPQAAERAREASAKEFLDDLWIGIWHKPDST
jgi:hypothetical protein